MNPPGRPKGEHRKAQPEGSPVTMDAAFHPGEVALQRLAGVDQRLEAIGRTVIRDHMPDQHRELFEKLPTLLLGAIDAQGQPWATMLAGAPGFIRTPNARTLHAAALPAAGDPVAPLLAAGAPVGLLGLEPHTRRRNRMNGHIAAIDPNGFDVTVQQSFGNCPKYVQAREPRWVARTPAPAQRIGAQLPPAARTLVESADTLFIASASAARIGGGRADGVDVSHRGGLPGFVKLDDAEDGSSRMTIPDYLGNFFFNTLGNLTTWPRAGLLFSDPDSGDVLQLAVETALVLDGDDIARYPGAQRLLQARVLGGWWRPAALPLRWSAAGYSPHLAAMAGAGQGKPEQD
jgi:predicted pyridoxine 5'-phosphate oxidase superfamily flavin-nucleotide-binding protein